jgi:hypothetical protein
VEEGLGSVSDGDESCSSRAVGMDNSHADVSV